MGNKLSSYGYGITIVDKDPEAFKNLSMEFSGFHILGNIVEFRILKKSNIKKASFFIATTGDDNTNIMVAQIAKDMFKVPLVVARVDDPKKKEIYSEMGIKTVSPTQISADVFLEKLDLKKDRSLLKGWL